MSKTKTNTEEEPKTKWTRSKKMYEKLYLDYINKYTNTANRMSSKNMNMVSDVMSFAEYKATRETYIDNGVKTNINRNIVKDQQYQFSAKVARALRNAAKENNYSWINESIANLRQGIGVDLTLENDKLKREHPDWNSYQRANHITNYIFGGSK